MSNPYPPNPYDQPSSYPPNQSQPGYSQYPGSQQYGSQPYGQPPMQPGYGQPIVQPVLAVQPQNNNKALVSLILGICSYVIGGNLLTGIPAIIFGHMAMREIDRSGGTQTGKPLALIGLILGYVAVVGTVAACLFLAIFVLGIFGAAATQH
jgi:hypothetical protein